MPEWLLAVTDTSSRSLAFLEGLDLVVVRRANNVSELQFNIEARDSRLQYIAPHSSVIKAYRDGVLRFHGRVWEPLVYKPSLVSVIAKDPWATIENRRVRTLTTFTATDQLNIAMSLISTQNGFASTGLAQGTLLTPTTTRDRTYEVGKPVGEAVRQLTEVLSGMKFTVDPRDNQPGVYAAFNAEADGFTYALEGVSFEYGEDTAANLVDYEVQTFLAKNRIVALGATVGDVQLTSVAEDAASIAEWGLFEEQVSFSTVEVQSTLDQHASSELRGDPTKVFSCTPAANSPMLWDDFDVNQLVNFYLKHGVLEEFGTRRVNEATVQVTNGNAELLANVVLQEL